MAITRTKKGNLVDTQIVDKASDDKKPELSPQTPVEAVKNTSKTKKKDFLSTTIAELKKSQWPSFSYVAKWSGVIIIFTAVFSIVLGGFDHTFNNGVKFIDCTSPKGRNQNVQNCGTEFLEKLIGR
jgi:preprotein translocase SecE subunit